MKRMHLPALLSMLILLGLAACYPPAGSAPTRDRATATAATPTLRETTPSPRSAPPAATPDATTVAIIAAVKASGQPGTTSYASPNRHWQVDLTVFDCVPTADGGANAYETLSLAGSGEAAARVVDSQLIYCGGLGAYGLDGLFWSPNSRYFYYTTAREGVPDGCGYWLPPIRRLDVVSGTVAELGGGLPSPDGARLATWLDGALVLWDLDQGEVARWPAADPAGALAALSWSPDSQAIAYLLAPSLCDPSALGKSIVVRTSVTDLSQFVLLETETPRLAGLLWEDAAALRLFDDGGGQWSLDENGLRELAPP